MSNTFKRYAGESLLIVFSVLFALFINKLFDDYQTRQDKQIAIVSISKELQRNKVILVNWKERHIAIRNRITDVLSGKNDSLKAQLESYDYLNLALLTDNESLVDAVISSTAWETAKTTGIISEFDFEYTQKLTDVYSMQEVVTDRTLNNIIEFYFDTESHDMDKLSGILTQLQLRFFELTGQEALLTSLYEKALGEI